jgi:hypothetical protein
MISGVRASSTRMLSTLVDDGAPVRCHVLEAEFHVVAQIISLSVVVTR